MPKKENKISKGFFAVVVIIIIITVFAWIFWSDVKSFIIKDEYRGIVIPTDISVVDANLKKRVLSELEEFIQYGKWPIPAVTGDTNRGNPFKPK